MTATRQAHFVALHPPHYSVTQRLHIGLVFLLIIVSSQLLFGMLTAERLIAKDEGFYVEAARLVTMGMTPYVDFFYPQAPLIPYFLAPFTQSWESVRGLVALLCTLQVTFVSLFVFFCTRSLQRVVLWAFVYVCNHFVLAWFVTSQSYIYAMTFALPALLLFAYFIEGRNNSRAHWYAAASGALLALAIWTRLYFGALVPLCLVLLIVRFGFSRVLFYFCIGGIVASLPVLALFLADPQAFLYNNLGYHMLRSTRSFSDSLQNKEVIARIIYGLRETRQIHSAGVPIFFWLTSVLALISLLMIRRLHFLSLAALLFIAVSLLPDPTYIQYFCLVVPMLMASSVCLLSQSKLQHKTAVRFTSYLLPLVLAVSSLFGIRADFTAYYRTGQGVIGLNPRIADDWNLKRLEQVREFLSRAEYEEPRRVFSLWSGYLIGTHHQHISGMENHFGIPAARRLTESQRERFHVKTLDTLLQEMRAGKVDIAILTRPQYRRGIKAALEQSCFHRVHEIGGVLIFERQDTVECLD